MCINVIYMNLPRGSHGASTVNDDGSFTVFLDPRDSNDMQRHGFVHEIRHIVRGDFDNIYDKNVGDIETNAHKKMAQRKSHDGNL